MFMKLALQSLLDRKGSVVLSIMAMTISIFVLLSVEHIRHEVKESFFNTVSGIDLIVGSRTGSVNLLLHSVFRIGMSTNNISWQSYEAIANSANVKWAIPISLGDSHKGFRVLGTNRSYFQYFSYGKQQALRFEQGDEFDGVFDVVLGSIVANKLDYQLGDSLTLAHGIADTSFSRHDNLPFKVVGILAPTGTPVDQTLHVSLQGLEAIHLDWQQGVKTANNTLTQIELEQTALQPKSITAFMLGLKSKIATFKVQRQINTYANEPLLAILPGVALSELWQMMSMLEKTLLLVSSLVFVAACLGVNAMLLSSIRERNREVQLLRVAGAPPRFLFFLLELEAIVIALTSIALASILLLISLALSQDYLVAQFGLHVSGGIFNERSVGILVAILVMSCIAALIPSVYIYKKGINVL